MALGTSKLGWHFLGSGFAPWDEAAPQLAYEAMSAKGTVLMRLNRYGLFRPVPKIHMHSLTLSSDARDVTTHDVSDVWRSTITGLHTMSLSIEQWLVPGLSEQVGVDSVLSSWWQGQITHYLFIHKNGSWIAFRGVVTEIAQGAPVEGVLTMSARLQSTDIPVQSIEPA